MVFLCLSCMFTDTGGHLLDTADSCNPKDPAMRYCAIPISIRWCVVIVGPPALSSRMMRQAVHNGWLLRDYKFSVVTKTCDKALQKIWNHVWQWFKNTDSYKPATTQNSWRNCWVSTCLVEILWFLNDFWNSICNQWGVSALGERSWAH